MRIVEPLGWIDRRFTYTLPVWNPGLELQAKVIPGIRVRRPGVIDVPWSALPLFQQLEVIDCQFDAPDWPLPNIPYDETRLRDALLAAGIFPGLVGDKSCGGLFSLAPFQKETIWKLWHLGGGLLHQAMGAGKTVQAICWAALIGGPVLVVTKTSVTLPFAQAVRDHWRKNPLDLPPPSQCPTRNGYTLSPETLLFEYQMQTDARDQVVIIGWQSLRIHRDLLTSYPFRAVIFDEIHTARAVDRWEWRVNGEGELVGEIKNNLSAAAYAIACHIPARLGLTGTPVFDRLRDLWGQWTLVEPRGLGRTAKAYLYRHCDARPGEYGGLSAKGRGNEEELKARLQQILVSVPREVSHAQLPPLQVSTRFVRMDEQNTVTGFKKEQKRLMKLIAKGDREAQQRLREVNLMEAAAKKRNAILEEIADQLDSKPDSKILIFTGRNRDVAELASLLQQTFPCGVLSGVEEKTEDFEGYSLPSRSERENRRQMYMRSTGPCIFVGTGYAYGTGLDWHDSDLLLIAMLPWSPGDLDQWIGRVWRNGQTRRCAVRILVAENSADNAMISALLDKVPVAIDIVGQESLAPVAERLTGRDEKDDATTFLELAFRLQETAFAAKSGIQLDNLVDDGFP